MIDFELGEELELGRQTAREFAADHLRRIVRTSGLPRSPRVVTNPRGISGYDDRRRRAAQAETDAQLADWTRGQAKLAVTGSMPAFQAPKIGEHTREIARELLGLDDEEIENLVAAGTLEPPKD